MPENQNQKAENKLEQLAFNLFGQRMAMLGSHAAGTVAKKCFRDADAFLKTATEIAEKGIKEFVDTNPLDDAYAPNLPKKHPLNLMSKEWGDLSRVRSVLKKLELDPKAEVLNDADIEWGAIEVGTARRLFPDVVKRAEQMEKDVAATTSK